MSESLPGQPPVPFPNPSAAPATNADWDATMQSRIAAAPFELSQEPVTPDGPASNPPAGTVPAPAYEHLGELPATYGTQSVYLVAYDPRQLFVYWDIDWAAAPVKKYSLHVCRPDGELETRVDISATDTGRYVGITRPGGTYFVELGTYGRDGSWQPVAFSGRVTMPPEGLSGELEPKFATLPFHLSFQRLLELIHHAMGAGDNLTTTLARLQQGDRSTVSALLGTLKDLTGDQLHTLERLLGQRLQTEAISSPAIGSEAPRLLRDRADVTSSGGGFGSEANLAAGAGGSENLSSSAFGSETMTSGGAFGSESVTSGGAFGSENLSSGGALGGESLTSGGAFGSETLTSGGAFGSESFSSGTLASFGSESLTSGSGFGSETLTSGGAFGSESLLGGLTGGSEILSSMGFGSEFLSSFGGPNSEAWRVAGAGAPGGSDLASSEHAAMFLSAVEKNLDVLSSLFSAFGSDFGSGASDGFSPGGW